MEDYDYTRIRVPLENRPILFLDVDGVLNNHSRFENGYCGIQADLVLKLNRVIQMTDAVIVITSAWRYLAIANSMTVVGIENMLLTHGLNCRHRVVAITRPDKSPEKCDRGQQISDWLRVNRVYYQGRYAVVDDRDDLDIRTCGHPFVQTDGTVGLTDSDVYQLIEFLGPLVVPVVKEEPQRQWDKPPKGATCQKT